MVRSFGDDFPNLQHEARRLGKKTGKKVVCDEIYSEPIKIIIYLGKL